MENKIEHKTKVVIYARFSSSRQNETSIEAQILECNNYCKRTNREIIGTYIDECKSAKTTNRQNFKKMIIDSYKKDFQEIIVYQLDRFTRNNYDFTTLKQELLNNGVRIVSVLESINPDEPFSIITESMQSAYAEYYSLELGRKVTRNMRLNASKGLFNGRAYTSRI